MMKEYGPKISTFTNKADYGFPNEKKFLIDAKWWQKWCDFTSFETT